MIPNQSIVDDIKDLMVKYPNLYKGGEVESGFYIGPGWLQLVDTLSAVLESEILDMPEDLRHGFYAVQVKQKFGSLRFYLRNSTPFLEGSIRLAENLSHLICEECGNPSKPRTPSVSHWIRALCEVHAKEHEAWLHAK